jgi:hypothetical protein
MTGDLYPQQIVKKTVGQPVLIGARNHLRGDLLIHLAHAEVLEMTAGEWMTVGEGSVTWVPEMSLQPEKIDVSGSQSDFWHPSFFMVATEAQQG